MVDILFLPLNILDYTILLTRPAPFTEQEDGTMDKIAHLSIDAEIATQQEIASYLILTMNIQLVN